MTISLYHSFIHGYSASFRRDQTFQVEGRFSYVRKDILCKMIEVETYYFKLIFLEINLRKKKRLATVAFIIQI